MKQLYLTCRDLAHEYPGALSEGSIRAACRRAPSMHPLPHLVSGGSRRPVIRIKPATYEAWLEEEAVLNVAKGGAR